LSSGLEIIFKTLSSDKIITIVLSLDFILISARLTMRVACSCCLRQVKVKNGFKLFFEAFYLIVISISNAIIKGKENGFCNQRNF